MSAILPVTAVVHSNDCVKELSSASTQIAGVRFSARLRQPGQVVPVLELPVNSVLIVECRPGMREDRLMISDLVKERAQPVIALVQDPSLADVRDLMRIGVVDVVLRPVAVADLRQALEHARERVQALPRRAHVLSFLRSCGGAGATTLALQTAFELIARDKRRETKVCFIDLDLQFGNAGVALDLTGTSGLAQVIDAGARFDAAFLTASMAHHDSGLDVLTAPGEIMPFEALTLPTVERILSFAQEQYDYVVVDLPHAWTGWTPNVLAASSLIGLVVLPTVSGIKRGRGHLKLIAEEGLGELPKLVVANRVERGWGSGWRRRIDEAATSLEHGIAVTVRRDDETANVAQESGRPLRAVKRNSVIEKDIRSFVDCALATMAANAPLPQAASHVSATASVSSGRRVLPLKAAS